MIHRDKTRGARLVAASAMTSLLLLQGCGVTRMITIDSDPQGAVVTANGRQIGHTPMQVVPDEVFPPHIYGTTYMVKGRLGIDMTGCERYSQEVNDLALSRDIRVSLDCAPVVKAAVQATGQASHALKPQTKPQPMPVPAHALPANDHQRTAPVPRTAENTSRGIEQRLQRLQTLHDKGLITDRDYAEQRHRILNEL